MHVTFEQNLYSHMLNYKKRPVERVNRKKVPGNPSSGGTSVTHNTIVGGGGDS